MQDEIVVVKFLTPYKVALLAIILMYCDGVIPAKSKMILMRHVVEFIDPHDLKSDSMLLDGDLTQLEDVMGSMESKIPGTSMFGLLLEFCFNLTSLDSLHSFMAIIDDYLIYSDGKHDAEDEQKVALADEKNISLLKQSSLLGSYCKRCYLDFDGLSFDSVISLWQYFETFRSGYTQAWHKIRPDKYTFKGNLLHDMTALLREQDGEYEAHFLQSLVPPPPSTRCIAIENLQALLEFQIGVFERYGGTLPEEIRAVLRNMVSTNKPLPTSAHYVQYLDAFRDKDYEAAFDHLHRFYDYTMNSKGRTHYQYALFTLATLQAEFSFYSEAMRAVEEAITVARENKDNNCLNYILSWLYSFLQSHPDCKVPDSLSSQAQISQFLRSRADSTSFALYSLSFQSEVEQIMATGGSLTQALEAMTKSSYINAVSNSAFAAGNLAVVSCSLWSRCGINTLANLALDSYSSFPERQPNALLTIEIGVKKAKLFFQEGNLPDCFELLSSLRETAHGSQWHQQIWYPKFLLLHLNHKLNQMRLNEAKHILQKLSGVATADTEVSHDLQYFTFIYEIKCGNISETMQAIWGEVEKLADRAEADVVYEVRLMLLYASLLTQTARPVRALSLVLKTIKKAEEATLAPFAYEGVVLLATISISKNQATDALSLLDAVMPRILESQDANLIASAYQVLAKASILIFKANKKDLDLPQQTVLLDRATDHFHKSGKCKLTFFFSEVFFFFFFWF